MIGTRYYKSYVERVIAANPTEIAITRITEVPDGYGGVVKLTEVITEVIAFYERTEKREVVSEYGKTYTAISLVKALSKGNANIIKGDMFTVDNIEYRVVYPKPYKDICKQIELEVIG